MSDYFERLESHLLDAVERNARPSRSPRRRRTIGRAFSSVVVLATVAASLVVLVVAESVHHSSTRPAAGNTESVPNISKLKPQIPGAVSEVLASDGSLLGYISSNFLRTVVPAYQLPRALREATVAIEDPSFWEHGAGGSSKGASTLTTQLVATIYMRGYPNHQSPHYKLIRAKLASELEALHSKMWILTQYLNDVVYATVAGKIVVGVGAASLMFFDKPVNELDLAQMALLAGLPLAPTRYNPLDYPKLAQARRSQVLAATVRAHYITQAQANAANSQSLPVVRNNAFEVDVIDYVEQQLRQQIPAGILARGGLKIYTTINPRDQALAAAAIDKNEGKRGDPIAALVSLDPSDGQIVAMQSSTASGEQFNYAANAGRPPGSAFAAFVLMTLIKDQNGDPFATYYDSHFLAPGWLPADPTYSVHTSEMSYAGTISVAQATTRSDNTVLAQLGVDLGMDNVDATARAMGITSPLYASPAEAIGGLRVGVSPLQIADAYATLANGGLHFAPTIINKVVLQNGSTITPANRTSTRVLTAGQAYEGTKTLESVLTKGTGTAAGYGCPAAGATGTTSYYTAAWFVGYTPQLSTAVWVGYPNITTSMNDVNGLGPGFGGTLAAPIWHDYMLAASSRCSRFAAPVVPWTGTAYAGPHSSTHPPATITGATPTATTRAQSGSKAQRG